MKKTSHLSVVIVTALCMASSGWMEAWAQTAPSVPNAATQPEIPSQTQPATSTAPGQPMKMNKCSDMIGTTVENPQGQKLGKIDEVVVDFNSGRVSYCVLSVAHGIFSTPKYLAVPLAAFQPSVDGSHLILNAGKDKIAQAQGFDRNNWPSARNPAWGAQPFWQSTPTANIAAPPNQNKNTPPGSGH